MGGHFILFSQICGPYVCKISPLSTQRETKYYEKEFEPSHNFLVLFVCYKSNIIFLIEYHSKRYNKKVTSQRKGNRWYCFSKGYDSFIFNDAYDYKAFMKIAEQNVFSLHDFLHV